MRNTSEVRGVYKCKAANKWVVSVPAKFNGGKTYHSKHNTKRDAERARKQWNEDNNYHDVVINKDSDYKKFYSYNPETGEIHSKVNTQNLREGQIVGKRGSRAYITVMAGQKEVYAHRLAWLLMTGSWPQNQIDHIDRSPHNNMWTNLRDVTCSQNAHNRTVSVNNKSGVTGVFWNKKDKRWVAVINNEGVLNYLGCYKDIDEAISARKEAEAKYWAQVG